MFWLADADTYRVMGRDSFFLNFLDEYYLLMVFVAICSFGDKDLDLRLSNPLHLRNLLEDSRFSKSQIVLLHASYPFCKEASYLASVYPQVRSRSRCGVWSNKRSCH